MVTHGHTAAGVDRSTYTGWSMMKDRCTNPNNDDWASYGGRGITFVKRWTKFENFLADMGARPKGKFLERMNNNGPYSRRNCVWADIKTQARNRRNNRRVTYYGREITIAELAETVKLPYEALRRRIVYRGWSVDRAASTPIMGV